MLSAYVGILILLAVTANMSHLPLAHDQTVMIVRLLIRRFSFQFLPVLASVFLKILEYIDWISFVFPFSRAHVWGLYASISLMLQNPVVTTCSTSLNT